MANLKNLSNEYAEALGYHLFNDTPKAVFAAIAVSALTCGGDQLDRARALLAEEWNVLFLNGIVPQKLTKAATEARQELLKALEEARHAA